MVQQSIVLMDAAGRRRSPASMPGFLAGRAPHNTGCSIRLTRHGPRRSSWSCAKPAMHATA